jgi:hypothetical protein
LCQSVRHLPLTPLELTNLQPATWYPIDAPWHKFVPYVEAGVYSPYYTSSERFACTMMQFVSRSAVLGVWPHVPPVMKPSVRQFVSGE